MRAAIGLRLLLALTFMGWGQLAFSVDFYWNLRNPNGVQAGPFPSPSAACGAVGLGAVPTQSPETFTCTNSSTLYASRHGNGCTLPAVYNVQSGECVAPKDCASTSGKEVIKAQVCTYDTALKTSVCDDQLDVDGCLFTAGGKKSCISDIASGKYLCTGSFFGSGQTAGENADSCTDDSCAAPAPGSDKPDTNCVSANGIQVCVEDKEEGCGSINGIEGCFQEKPGCGYFNGTYQCHGADKPNRNCGYYNGKQTCFDPKDPTKIIPETSPDHPKNGGNADGNENNDPTAPGSTTGSAQGSDQPATNEGLEALGGKIDKTNSLLDGITGILDGIGEDLSELSDGLLGDEYDGGDDAGMTAGEAGTQLGDAMLQELADAQETRSVEDELYLEKIARDIDGKDFFGDNSQIAELLQFADGLLPSHTGCVDYSIPLELGNYRANITLPMCRIAALRPLLEWVIYIVTAIGLWNIAYSTLRMENAKASKGGF